MIKKTIILALFFISALSFSQEKETVFEREGDSVKATYYYDSGEIKVQGYFKNKKLTGTWTSFDKEGNKTGTAQYKDGKKVGDWLVFQRGSLQRVSYHNNTVLSISNIEEFDSGFAINNDD